MSSAIAFAIHSCRGADDGRGDVGRQSFVIEIYDTLIFIDSEQKLWGMDQLLRDAARRSLEYLRKASDRPVCPPEAALRRLDELDPKLPDDPTPAAETLRLIDDFASPATVTTTGPRYFGFVVGGALPVSVAAHWLATAWDQNVGMAVMSPSASRLEQVAGAWLLDLLGLPPTSACGFVTGTTTAHITALAAARHAVLARAGWDVERRGLNGAPPVQIVGSREIHSSLYRALAVLGLGRDGVTHVDVDSQGRLRPDRLPPLRAPAIVVAQAGNVNTGAFDPIDELCAAAAEAGAWVHVDGAFGLWAAAAPSTRRLVAGLAGADSWATDGHKWLNVPYDSGVAIVRDPAAVRAAMAMSASYLVRGQQDGMEFTPELSRRARGVDVWAALRTLGRSGVADLIERSCAFARRFAEQLSAAGAEILNDVVLNQVLVSFGSDERTRRTVEGIQKEGTCWCGTTEWQGRVAMRISVSGWNTTADDVNRSVAAMLRVWSKTVL